MISILKNLIRNNLRKYGYEISSRKDQIVLNRTPANKIKSFINSLHPFITDKDLIRLGTEGDGGYLVPDDLKGIEACFSPGVDQISEFVADCFNNGLKIFLADKTVSKPNLKLPQSDYSFLKKFIGYTNDENHITMDKWVNNSNVNRDTDLLLQMDIEGWEYFSLINMSDSLLKRFRIVVIEFHDLYKIWNRVFFELANTVFNKLLNSHTCVHIHPNNCCGIDNQLDIKIPRIAEFTFIRNDRIKEKKLSNTFPNKLDFDNTSKEHIALPENWYSNN